MNEKGDYCIFSLLKDVFKNYLQNLQIRKKTFIRVLGNLDQIFQISTIDFENNNEPNKKKYLMTVKEKLTDSVDNELLFGLLEYKGDYLLLNLEFIVKECSLISGKKYFFLGEIVSINDILMMVPTIYSIYQDDLDLYVYEKTVELLNHVYK